MVKINITTIFLQIFILLSILFISLHNRTFNIDFFYIHLFYRTYLH